MAEFLQVNGEHVIFTNLFNEQHTGELLSSLQGPVSSLQFHNVGIKVMRLILNYFEEAPIRSVSLDYDWNTIMTTPQLVCYDKSQWKTLQQLANWNRQWNQLFFACYSLAEVRISIKCSWMDDQFARKLLEGVAKLPNISAVRVELASKAQGVEDVLQAFQKAGLFQQYQYSFTLIK